MTKKLKLSDLQQDPNNLNLGTERGRNVIRQSLAELGAGRSILVDKNGYIIAGNKTAAAALEAGIEDVVIVETTGDHVVVVQRTDLDLSTDPKAKKLAVTDNRASELGLNWDIDALKVVADEVDISWLFTDEEIEGLDGWEDVENLETEGLTDEDEIPDPEDVETRVKKGDIWRLGRHRVMCGDSTVITDVERLMDGEKADMVFTDPPYGISIVSNKSTVGGNNIAKSKTYAKIENDESTDCARAFYHCCQSIGLEQYIVWGGNYFTDFLPPSPCWIVWDKQNTGNFADVELAWCSLKKGAKLYSFMWNGLAREGDRKSELSSRVHPTQKPVGMFEKVFADFEFNTCYDGFLGSGTTLIAAEKTGRTCYGMELSEKYCDVILKRWEDFTGQTAERI